MKTFEWCRYNWTNEMEGHRIIQSKYPWYWYSIDTIMRDGTDTLELSIRKNPKDIKHYNGVTYHSLYEAATMRSLEDFGYGTFSCEMMMPTGRNLWASFWLSGSGNWPPEIDINEGESGEKSSYFRMIDTRFPWIKPSWRTTNNIHYRDENMDHRQAGQRNVSYIKQPKDSSKTFIEYKCEWRPEKITFYANGKITRTVAGYICKQLTENINNPEKGFKMNVIFNVWCDNPDCHDISMMQPMLIRNFKYKPL